MPITLNYTDKFLAGVNHSFTITSDEGLPQAEVLVGESPIPCRVIHMQNPKYKVSFRIPENAAGKEVTLKFKAGEATLEESKEITTE